MQALNKRLSRALLYYSASIRSVNGYDNSLFSQRTITTSSRQSICQPPVYEFFASPWSATQLRSARFSGADVRPGNVIERRGKIYQIVGEEIKDLFSLLSLERQFLSLAKSWLAGQPRGLVPSSWSSKDFLDDMKVTVQLYDERPMSASVPQRVTCTVMEAAEPIKGIGATPHYKKVLLDNGLTIQFIVVVTISKIILAVEYGKCIFQRLNLSVTKND
ncbi:unnamed protein product [Fraxinus pennsylvanica]|uniref:Uncharacterized protein n=1 Tax=Fraxinus pennsylvanica TaxID=56036 RepID=A0AAD1ZG03_9LAMI|nr:unnamed protein product [Fraxinus pennsylvanica]